MLLRWRQINSTVINTTAAMNAPSPCSHQAYNGASTNAVNADRDEIRDTPNTASQVRIDGDANRPRGCQQRT